MEIKDLKFTKQSNFKYEWLFKTFNERCILVIYFRFTGNLHIDYYIKDKNSKKHIIYDTIVFYKINTSLSKTMALKSIKKYLDNIPIELVDMLLTVKGL